MKRTKEVLLSFYPAWMVRENPPTKDNCDGVIFSNKNDAIKYCKCANDETETNSPYYKPHYVYEINVLESLDKIRNKQ